MLSWVKIPLCCALHLIVIVISVNSLPFGSTGLIAYFSSSVRTPERSIDDSKSRTGHTGGGTDPSQSDANTRCMHCKQPLSKVQAAQHVTQCHSCSGVWHSRCYYGEDGDGPECILCHKCHSTQINPHELRLLLLPKQFNLMLELTCLVFFLMLLNGLSATVFDDGGCNDPLLRCVCPEVCKLIALLAGCPWHLV